MLSLKNSICIVGIELIHHLSAFFLRIVLLLLSVDSFSVIVTNRMKAWLVLKRTHTTIQEALCWNSTD